jgi:hypothetical protein
MTNKEVRVEPQSSAPEGADIPIDKKNAHQTWSTRRKIARTAFGTMLFITLFVVGTSAFLPAAAGIWNAISGVLLTIYASFSSIVMFYMGARAYVNRVGQG